MNTTYTRGTKTHRSTTKGLCPGDVVLTADAPANPQFALNTGTKTGATLRTVAGSEYVEPRRELGERNRRIVVTFTDGTRSPSEAPATTWAVVDVPAVETDPAEDWVAIVKAGEAAPLAQHEAPIQTGFGRPAGTCACCGRATKGGHYLPGHDAKHVACLVAEVRTGRDRLEALAEIPLKHHALVDKVQERVARLGLL